MITKICPRCKKEKELSEYYPRKDRPLGIVSRCKECTLEKMKAIPKSVIKGRAKKMYLKHRKRRIEDARRYRKEHPDYAFKSYGMTKEIYENMFTEQNGLCAICGQREPVRGRRLSIDHHHGNGIVRGLLCTNCNRALGYFKDDVNILNKAVQYLHTSKTL